MIPLVVNFNKPKIHVFYGSDQHVVYHSLVLILVVK